MNRPPPGADPVVAELQLAAPGGDMPSQVYDCWNTIGVQGNATCGELQKFIHCRNCPVYSAAGIQLLDRPLPVDYRREWTDHFAREKKLTTPARTSVVIFRVSREWLALPTRAFQEVAEQRAIHTLPHRQHRVALGLVNVRGELLICASLGRLLGLDPGTTREGQRAAYDRLLVANWDGNRLAFPVEEVHGVHRLHQDRLQEPPATIARAAFTYTQGVFSWRGHTVGLLNSDALFTALNHSLT